MQMDRKPQRSTPPQVGQKQPAAPSPQPEQPLRIPVVRGLSPGERQNPSPLVASVIAHQEQTVRRYTSGLEAYAPQQKQQKSPQQSSRKPLFALLSWLQDLMLCFSRKR